MDKEGIMIYLCMKGQNEWLEEVKAYFQKSSYVLKVIEIDDWQNELSLTNQKGKILLEKIKKIQLKNKRIYLSLGSKEHKTRNALMKNVLKNTLEAYKIYQKENDCFFQKNNGNHFFESELRMKKGWDWFFYEK